MRIDIVSDIHAYLPSLQDALNHFKQEEVAHIICAGDLVDGGRDGEAVVSLLRQRQIPCVQGNHDRDAFGHQAWIRRSLRASGETSHPFRLTSETTAYLSGLPTKVDLEFKGVTICLAHGTPDSNTIYTFPDAEADHFHEVASATNAEVIVLGHTHTPICVQYGARWVMNPGSTYMNRFHSK
ncbi:MAG: metallophosphoesterase family protein, partial [Chloroflexota bacterium]